MSSLTVYERARSRLLIYHQFFATFLLSTPAYANYTIDTACTDMRCIWYNPEFIESLDVEIAMFVMAHEACHILLKHGLRVGSRDPELANIAMDHAINLMLKKYGFKLWPHCCCDARFTDMPWEEIYEILKQEEKSQPKPKPGEGDGDDDKTTGPDGKPLPRKGQGKPRTGRHSDRIGNDCTAPRDVTPEQVRKIEDRIDAQVMQAVQQARMAGTMPAGMELLVEGIIKPPVMWYDVLRDLMLQTVHLLENWSRPNRRQPSMPSYKNPGMGKLGFIGDSSGSVVSDKIYAQVEVEIREAVELTNPEQVIVVWADHAECSHEQIFEPGDEIIIEPRGGGGTDMRLPLKYMEEHEVAVCILVTDCETPWPDQPTPFPLIILATRDCPAVNEVPEWAHVIRIR